MKFLWFLSILLVVLRRSVVSIDDLYGFDDLKAFEDLKDDCMEKLHPTNTSLMVSKSIIEWASVKGAVCLDGSPPAYYMHPGHGSGADSWVINLEGGGWCNNLRACQDRAKGRHGSSACMAPELPFDGILSNKSEENPDFFNWNRVLVRYCDGASFTGHSQNKTRHLNFRGQKIWVAVMEELMSKGMRNANQALLTGCSAGGLATILHCDEFGDLFPTSTNVKCFSDAGLFLDVVDVHGYSTLRKMFGDVVNLQGVKENLPKTCTDHMDPTSCFFPQNFIARIKTPMFILNAAYDVWQVQESLTKGSDDWHACARNHSYCNASQIDFLQGFRNQMLDVVKDFSKSKKNGLFINSCFDHCQTKQDRWFAEKSPRIDNKTIAESVGDWYFDRSVVKKIDRPYPCDKTCINIEQRV